MAILLALACTRGPFAGNQIAGNQIGEEAGTPPAADGPGRVRALSGAGILAGEGLGATFFELRGVQESDLVGEYTEVAGDLDGDGLSELVFRVGSRPHLLKGATIQAGGTGSLEDLVRLTEVERAYAQPAGDLTGDGVADLLVSDDVFQSRTTWSVLSGAALEGVPVARIVHGAEWELGSAGGLGDVDGDGVADLLASRVMEQTGDEASDLWEVLLLLGPFEGERSIDAPDRVLTVPAGRIGDVDGDGLTDLAGFWPQVTNNRDPSELLVFPGADLAAGMATAPETAPWTLAGIVGHASAALAGDLDGDGRDEIWLELIDQKRTEVFAGGSLSDRRIGEADLSFSERPRPLLADLDGDGDREVVAVFYLGDRRGEIRVFEDLALDGRSVERSEGVVLAEGVEVGWLHLVSPGDLNGDGADDLVIAEPLAFSAD